MARLEDLQQDVWVLGIIPDASVRIVSVSSHGADAVNVIYRDETGRLGEELIYREREPLLQIINPQQTWSFAAPADQVQLAAEALRIRLGYLFDPLMAVHLSRVEPLPHQITAVYDQMLARQPLRYVLADDPGAGKTIMSGLLIKELFVRGDVQRCLIVCPGSLVEQWQDELAERFQLEFEILTREAFESARVNWFEQHPFVLARLDHLSRNDEFQQAITDVEWDLVIFDEAHKLSASFFSGDVKKTRRYELGETLGLHTRHLLLLTATPHNGKEEDFQLFMALLDRDRFEGKFRDGTHQVDTSDLMRRLVKEDLLRFDGRPLFPERIAYTLSYELSSAEAELYEDMTKYVREEFARADEIGGGRKGTVGFALTILQRRLASSPEAIYQSLRRRRERLQQRLLELEQSRFQEPLVPLQAELATWSLDSYEDFDEWTEDELEQQDVVLDQATTALTIEELQKEITTLEQLEQQALRVRQSGTDTKWEQLSALLQNKETMIDSAGRRRKLVIFTEHRDTLNYLTERIRQVLGRSEAVITISGGMNRRHRHAAEEAFRSDPQVAVLVATDAAGEGINLQRAHLMVNYDLPWNPNRLEQRFGRIHRIGQTEVCLLWNLLAKNTREGLVYERLLQKLEVEQKALKGKVFNVLGKLRFGDKPLHELLLEAIRYGDSPEVRARLTQVVDHALDHEHILELLRERSLVHDTLDMQVVQRVREDMERAAARRLQPHFISSFFKAAFAQLGGVLREREQGRYELTNVPLLLRQASRERRRAIAARYERITFDKNLIDLPGKPPAAFVCPGHPLLDATIDVISQHYGSALEQGTILVAGEDWSSEPRLLVVLEHALQDGRRDRHGQRQIVSRQLHFLEIDSQQQVTASGLAPYYDYRLPKPHELTLAQQILAGPWLQQDLKQVALDHAIQTLVSEHLNEFRQQKDVLLDRTEFAVQARLTKEIFYWDQRAYTLKEQERAGKQPKINSERARQRAEELRQRLSTRLAEIKQERAISPTTPRLLGVMLILPNGLIAQMLKDHDPGLLLEASAARQTELRAMTAVLQTERALGYEPRDVSASTTNMVYDIESQAADGSLRMIEVKGCRSGTEQITITRNEIHTALNVPDQWILALVLIPDDPAQACEVYYIRHLFTQAPDVGVAGSTYSRQFLRDKGSEPS